jgi:hypothetical protein
MWTSNLAAKKLRIKSSLRKNNLIISTTISKTKPFNYERTNLSELARELGISAPRLYRWQKA